MDILFYIEKFLITYGSQLLGILALFAFGKIILRRVVKKIIRLTDVIDHEDKEALNKRAETVGHIIITTGNVIIYAIILFMLLSIFGVNMGPILTGAGIIGLAVGFGSQALVKDFVSGLLIFIENQYDIGDRVKIGSFEGEVIKVTMRSTMIRDDEGNVIFTPNGSVKNVVNYSKK